MMHACYLLGLFLFLGIDRGASIGKPSRIHKPPDYTTTREKKLLNPIGHNWRRTREMDQLEGVVNAIYFFLIDSSQAEISLRSNRPRASSLAHSISIIGDSVRNDVMESLKKIGFSVAKTASGNSKWLETNSLAYNVHYQLLKMPLELGPIAQQIQSRTKKYSNLKNNGKFYSAFVQPPDSITEWQSLVISEDLKNVVSRLSECLAESKASFDLKKACGTLINLPLEKMRDVLRRRMKNRLPKYLTSRRRKPTNLECDVCQALVENVRTDGAKCLGEIRLVSECLETKLNGSLSSDSGSDSLVESSANLIRSAKALDPTCTNAPGDLGFLVKCTDSQTSLKTKQDFFLTDLFIGDMKKSAKINRMANQLVSGLKNTRIGAEAAQEIATFISVHQNAGKKLANLSRASSGKNRQEISRRLLDYENNLAGMGLRILKNFNEAVSDVQQIFVHSNDKHATENLSPNVKVIKCFNKLIESIFNGIWSLKQPNHENGNNMNVPTTLDVSGVSDNLVKGTGFVKKTHDKRFEDWVDSMKRMRKSGSPRRSTALVSLARTFLLATMFYECIALLGAVLYRENSAPLYQQYEAENNTNDDWRESDDDQRISQRVSRGRSIIG